LKYSFVFSFYFCCNFKVCCSLTSVLFVWGSNRDFFSLNYNFCISYNFYEFIDDGRDGMYKISLLGRINECKVIKPRYPVKKTEFEKFEKRYLPSRDIGMLIVSTPKGVMNHSNAKENSIGGRLLAFIY